MDHKSWLWKKKSTEKTIVADDKNPSLDRNEEETHLDDKAELERDPRILKDKLSSALSECNARDDFAKKQAKIAQEAIAGWEKAEAEAVALKLELDKALQQRAASEERLIHLDAALKECMQQLRFIREDQEKRIHDAVMKASKEFQRTRIVLDEKLEGTTKRLSKVDGESTRLNKALLVKEKVIEELNKQRANVEADFSALMTRLESTEKENASLKYEVRVLEKELEIRNEEREFNCRTADVSHKQHLESVKKIAKLESECQRLRLLVRKRLPGPAALAKMKNEVDMLGKDQPETRRRKSNPSLIGSVDFYADVAPDTPRKQINFLTEQLCVVEEENRTLRETLNKRTKELQFSRITYAQTASKLSQLEGQLRDHIVAEPGKNVDIAHELSLASMSDLGSDDKVSCAESSASALISNVGASDMRLMDDFVEMEKLAVMSADNPIESDNHIVENNAAYSPLQTQSSGNAPEAAATETPLVHDLSDMPVSSHQNQSKVSNKVPGWLEEMLQSILEKSPELKRNPDEVLEEIKAALRQVSHQNSQCINSKGSSHHLDALCAPANMAQGSPEESLKADLSYKEAGDNILTAKKCNQKLQPNLSLSIQKIIELIKGVSMQSMHDGNSVMFSRKDDRLSEHKNSETSTGYVVRVFQWKTSELSATLELFIQACSDLLSGKSDLESFAEQLTSTLDWTINHCFSLQDVSSMKDAIKNHFDWDDSRSESEVDSGTIHHFSESNKMQVQGGEVSPFPLVSVSNCHNSHFEVEEVQHNGEGENRRLKDEVPNNESEKKDLEGRLQEEIHRSESLRIQLQESSETIESLQKEVNSLKQMKDKIEDQSEKHKMVEEDLETQLTRAKNQLNNACEKQMYLEIKNNSCEKSDVTCHHLQLQLERLDKKEIPEDMEHPGSQLQDNWEIAAASEKLAECQETILNLGKQLKALASPSEAALFDKVISSPARPIAATLTTEKKVHQRSSLLDKMLAEDRDDIGDLKSPKAKDIIVDANRTAFRANETSEIPERFTNANGIDHQKNETAVNSLAIVPINKRGGGGFLRKLLRLGKKGIAKKNDLFTC